MSARATAPRAAAAMGGLLSTLRRRTNPDDGLNPMGGPSRLEPSRPAFFPAARARLLAAASLQKSPSLRSSALAAALRVKAARSAHDGTLSTGIGPDEPTKGTFP